MPTRYKTLKHKTLEGTYGHLTCHGALLSDVPDLYPLSYTIDTIINMHEVVLPEVIAQVNEYALVTVELTVITELEEQYRARYFEWEKSLYGLLDEKERGYALFNLEDVLDLFNKNLSVLAASSIIKLTVYDKVKMHEQP